MKIIVCLDDDGGMLFGGRRQSRDRVLLADASADAKKRGGRLFITEFSRKLFEGEGIDFCLDNNMLANADTRDTCFVENLAVGAYTDRIDEIVVYRWNRKYPHDFSFDISPEDKGFKKEISTELVGSSHEKITKEIFVK